MGGKPSSAEESPGAPAEPRPVSRMSLADRGRIIRVLESLAGDYELERVEGKYRVTRGGQALSALDVCRCGDGVRLFVRGCRTPDPGRRPPDPPPTHGRRTAAC
jgi:hypothetical protein